MFQFMLLAHLIRLGIANWRIFVVLCRRLGRFRLIASLLPLLIEKTEYVLTIDIIIADTDMLRKSDNGILLLLWLLRALLFVVLLVLFLLGLLLLL
jgi:hypothetical protein